jgi:serine O-acetyltransferase
LRYEVRVEDGSTAEALLLEEARTREMARAHTAGCARSFHQLREWLKADLYRYAGVVGASAFWRHFLIKPGYKYTVWMRTCGYFKLKRWAWPLYAFTKWMLMRCRYKYGIAIPEYTMIGPGLFINRFGGVMINGDAVIGANCNITHGAMLGQSNRGAKAGSPILGDRVFLAAGSKVVGRVVIGDDAVVGANAVVTKDVPAKGVVGGIPAKLISLDGSAGYVNRLAPAPPAR